MIEAKIETTRGEKWLIVKMNDCQVPRMLNMDGLSKDDIQKIIYVLEEEKGGNNHCLCCGEEMICRSVICDGV